MLTEAKNNIRYFFNAIKIGIKSAMAYKASFIMQTLFMVVNNSFFLIFWSVVFKNANTATDLSFDNILYIWSFSTISYGIAYFFFDGAQRISDYIITGAMDSFLLQPKNVFINVLTSRCSFSAFGDLLYGIVIGAIATGGDIPKTLLLIVIGVFGSVFFISTEVILRSLAVWIGDTESIANRYKDMLLITFSTYPESIFGIGIKVLLYTVIPVAYLSYIPAKVMSGISMKYLACVFIVGTIYFIIAIKVFNKAMCDYESGNSMAMKG